MNKYARLYFDITQNRDIKDTLYKTLTKKEKKNFIKYESKSNKKIDHNDDIKLNKFGMKLIEFISVLFVPFIVIIISLFLIYMMYVFDGLIPHNEFIYTDLPDPVCPATIQCGPSLKSAANGDPSNFVPNAAVVGSFAFVCNKLYDSFPI